MFSFFKRLRDKRKIGAILLGAAVRFLAPRWGVPEDAATDMAYAIWAFTPIEGALDFIRILKAKEQ